ncbi:RagB/SusD family nutrient uptake outer membrane protein [Pedobacter sp. KBW06]|uniref:RagB/SusD family nutrient uptake outer membrane protein n=1 Tax=Pedobacter sp. KBW06 TaxID=2153359 RepID=UPI000F59B9BA|nr:RagB/SusD family nutrient uptake outer membrane protein [Pedobacter sp. KBW06]RQO75622.1 RagB/SusD family nutrient uptake outer membrane protein [Pedobacter sp. KBW06]
MKLIIQLKTLPIILCILHSSCKKFINIDPPNTQILSNLVFTSDATATAAVTGIYSRLAGSEREGFASGGLSSITYLTALSSDELISYSTSNDFYKNAINPNNTTLVNALWQEPYNCIYSANLVLEGLDKYQGVSPAVKRQLQGEVKFIRAFCYFHLLNLFENIPLHLSTDFRINSVSPAAPKAEVYDQITEDLKQSVTLLTGNYSPKAEVIRANQWAAMALLARVYLYTSQWQKAEQTATSIIESGYYSLSTDLNSVFLKNSIEAIWQLKPIDPLYNTNEGKYFRLQNSPLSTGAAALNSALVLDFDSKDKRRRLWIDSISISGQKFYFSSKYKISGGHQEPLVEYSMILRLAEQYLIRAEARAMQGNSYGAKADLNQVRHRSALPELTTDSQTEILQAITTERRHELFMEWGQRWYDLKRLQLTDQILTPAKPQDWQSSDALYPIPQKELSNNHNLKQNTGYQ